MWCFIFLWYYWYVFFNIKLNLSVGGLDDCRRSHYLVLTGYVIILNVDVERRKSECCWLGGATADSGTAEARLLLLLQCHSAGDSEVGPRVGTELQVSVSHVQGTWRLPYTLPWCSEIGGNSHLNTWQTYLQLRRNNRTVHLVENFVYFSIFI